MVFEKETNLYQDAAIRSKFTSQDTQFSVIQGKISYLITDSEIATYDDGKGTITSRNIPVRSLRCVQKLIT